MTTGNDVLKIERAQTPGGLPLEIWTLDRPQALNAINAEVIERLEYETHRLSRQLRDDLKGCRAVIVRGAGDKAFAAGADIAAMKHMSATEAGKFATRGQHAFAALEDLPVPVIAVVQGFALGGGCELAMSCDFILAGPKAKFGQPEAHLGLVPGFAGSYRFVRKLGYSKALELLCSGAMLGAADAKQLGLVQRLSADGGDVNAEALAFADELCKKSSPLAVAKVKELLRQQSADAARLAQEREAQCFAALFATEETREGLTAFLEKRAPNFKGR